MSKWIKNSFAGLIIAAVVAAVIGGIIVLGPPSRERMRRLDERRVCDLKEISEAIDTYWSRYGKLPSSITELSYSKFYIKPFDPETKQPYEYKVLNEKNYELCAHFALASSEEQDPYYKILWSHGSGRQCFQLSEHAKQ